MSITRDYILGLLPPYLSKWETVVREQNTDDIIDSMLKYHRAFIPYYDRIGGEFWDGSIGSTADGLYEFCKNNIQYREETKEFQTVGVPNGVLIRGFADCKGFASFIGGCLDAINRKGVAKIDWCYCFASYQFLLRTPYHVFVVCWDEDGQEIWIDPTPRTADKYPVWEVREYV